MPYEDEQKLLERKERTRLHNLRSKSKKLGISIEEADLRFPRRKILTKEERKSRQKTNNKEQKAKHAKEMYNLIWEYKISHPCKCGENFPPCLHFHHLDPTQKEFSISKALKKSQFKIKTEIAKCDLLCANCHIKEHNKDKLPQYMAFTQTNKN